VASILYFSAIGSCFVLGSSNADVPSWVIAWATFVPFDAVLFHVEPSSCGSAKFGFAMAFSTSGYLSFLSIPIVLLWIVGYSASWVRQGFKKTK